MDPRSSFRVRLRPSPFGLLLGVLLLVYWVLLFSSCITEIGLLRPERREPAMALQRAPSLQRAPRA